MKNLGYFPSCELESALAEGRRKNDSRLTEDDRAKICDVFLRAASLRHQQGTTLDGEKKAE